MDVFYFIHALHYLTQISVNTISAGFNVIRRFHLNGKITNATDVIDCLWSLLRVWIILQCLLWQLAKTVNVYIYMIFFKNCYLITLFINHESGWKCPDQTASMTSAWKDFLSCRLPWKYTNWCLSPLKLWVSISLMARCTRYNIMW